MTVSVLKDDVLLPSLHKVIRWMGAPSPGALFDQHFAGGERPSRETLERIAQGKGTLQQRTQAKLDSFFGKQAPAVMENVHHLLTTGEGCIGFGSSTWMGWVSGLSDAVKAEYPYTLSLLEAIVQLETLIIGQQCGSMDLAAALKSTKALHPALLLYEQASHPASQVNTLLLILSALDAEYSAGHWLVDPHVGLLYGLIQFKRDGHYEDYNRALWERLLQIISDQQPLVSSWNQLDVLMANQATGEKDLESIERKLRRYRTGKNSREFRVLIAEICAACWTERDTAQEIADLFQLLHRGATLFDALSIGRRDTDLSGAAAETAYTTYFAFHEKRLTGT